MIAQGVAALHQGLDAALAEGKPLHGVPAQAVAQGVGGVRVGPDAPVILRRRHGVQGGLPQQLRSDQGAAEGGQVAGGGVDAAGAHQVQAVLGQGPGVRAPVGFRQPPGVEGIAGGEGVFQARGLQDTGPHVVHEFHAGDGLHHQLRQGEAIVTVDAVCAGISLQPLSGKLLQQTVGGHRISVPEQHGVLKVGPHQPGGVVQQHPHGDLPVPLVRHFEVLQVPGHRSVQGHAPRLRQLHHRHSGVDFADGADAVENIVGQGPVLRPGVAAAAASQNHLAVLPQGVLDTVGAAVGQSTLGGTLSGFLQGGYRLFGHGGDRQAQRQHECQQQGAPALPKFHKHSFPAPWGRWHLILSA